MQRVEILNQSDKDIILADQDTDGIVELYGTDHKLLTSTKFNGALVVRPDDQVVAVGVDREVPVDHLWHQKMVSSGDVELLAKDGPDSFLERRVVLARFRAEVPLVPEQRRLVEETGDLVDR